MREPPTPDGAGVRPGASLARRITLFLTLLLVAWTAVAAALVFRAYRETRADAMQRALVTAKILFNKDLLYRRWAAGHGGVYVPATEGSPANPYLEGLPERDLTTPSGRRLTLVNPAYMTRQVYELAQQSDAGPFAHITSLRLLNPRNAPDPWEADALRAFERGVPEITAVTGRDSESSLRLMRPLLVEEPCLKCHRSQGYSVGEVRGGISVTVPMGTHLAEARAQARAQAEVIGVGWLLGVLGIAGFWVFLVRDFAAQRRLEETLRESEERYRGLFEASHDALMTLAPPEWRFASCNPAALRMFRVRDQAEFTALGPWALSPERQPDGKESAEKARSMIERAMREGAHSFEWTHRRADGETFAAEVLLTRMTRGAAAFLQATVRDISERKVAEGELIKYATALVRSNRELDQFADVISHDLREPLRMVSSFAGMLERDYGERLDERGREFARFAVDGAVRMQQLLDSLVVYARVTTRPHPLAPVALEGVLGEALQNLALAIEEQGARIAVGALPMVNGDRIQLVQLFQNLVANALKYHAPGAPPLVEIDARRESAAGGMWVLSVRDHGIGIDPKQFERVFVIFQRLHTAAEYPGTGLGLALCRKIVERHGGRIWVESEPGQGATFFFALPAGAP